MEDFKQIIVLACCYSLLFLLCLLVWKNKSENIISLKTLNGNWKLLHLRHAGGASIMILLPVFFLPELPMHLLVWPGPVTIVQAITLLITGLIILALVIKDRESLSFEENNDYNGSSLHEAIHIVLRSFFLISYEWFFRGCILFSCIYIFGTAQAILINLGLYAFIHSFNGRKEIYGSVPFGLILCVFTLWYQSVWPAILLHLLLSFSHESFLLHPFFKKSKTVL
jgi:membrane protease YdiL (CAAX protease family)